MIEKKGNIWNDWNPNDVSTVICITTNGFVKKNGEAVMGAGIAKQAKLKMPWLPKLLGSWIKEGGNFCRYLTANIISFPVKHNWYEKADLKLIESSAESLKIVAERRPTYKFLLPRPGCGNGKLNWEVEVRPLLERVGLPDNVIVYNL